MSVSSNSSTYPKLWNRPASMPYPKTWTTFSKTNKDGKLINFEIQDLTEDLYLPALEFLKQYYLPYEPVYNNLGIMDDPISIKEQIESWEEILPERLSLVCLVKDDKIPNKKDRIVGVLLLYYRHINHDEENEELQGETIKVLYEIVRHIENQVDRFKLINSHENIETFGLSVLPAYKGMGIGAELLSSIDLIGKEVGLSAVFASPSSIASQESTHRAGFIKLLEIEYSDIQKLFPRYSFNIENSPTIQYVYKQF